MQKNHSTRPLGIGFLPILIILLAVITAVIHLILSIRGFVSGRGGPFPLLFLLNCIGYLVLVTALYLPLLRSIQRFTRWVLIAYTAITIILWYVLARNHAGLLASIDKPAEGALLILLLVEGFWLHLHKGELASQ